MVRARPVARLGLLGRVAATACTIEAYSDAPSADEARACLQKHLAAWRSCVARDRAAEQPFLWVLSTGHPTAVLDGLRMGPMAGWPAGVYEGPRLLRTLVVVLGELPRERSTILIRLMGGGRVLREAIEDLRELSEDAPERAIALGPLLRFRVEIAKPGPTTPEEEEFMMTTQELVEQFIEQGRKQGLAQATIELYEARFGPMPPALRSAVEAMRDLATLRKWHLLAGTGTREAMHDAVSVASAARSS
ncbi:uncharacterized protein SOCEGT47_004940 [Sorangium cellulosum]|uniref:Uncharacterized protein n=1 Tax=Sorangium cellulosum TaxID=56 RepID=A0A4V0NCQ9_SORCE|nr:uncharacterized protein SOCEGT47_004940 [Sorangium cellulosum]